MKNLITDPWLFYRLKDNSIKQLPISAIADPNVVDFVLPRADFYGAAYQFAIGLLHTCCSPKEQEDWQEWYEDAPSTEELADMFSQAEHAFNISGDGALFMQDFDTLDGASSQPVNTLLIETPGENTLKQNTDHFIKRGQAQTLSIEMAALALFTLQINAPAGGVGYRTGLRGGGPLTTLLLPNEDDASLWQKLWLNVCIGIEQGDLHSSLVFPWLGQTKVSKGKNTETLQKDVHFLTHFWAMPRRIRLNINDSPCTCALTEQKSTQSVSCFITTNYGNNYAGSWQHPLTHYRSNPKKPHEDWLSSKGQPGGVRYKQWHALCFEKQNEGNHPALVIQDFYQTKIDGDVDERPRLWAFGFDMDNMKARGWYESQFPLYHISEKAREQVIANLGDAVQLSQEFCGMLRTQLKEALFDRPKDVKTDLAQHQLSYWQRTEHAFFELANQVCESEQLPSEVAKRWFYTALNTVLDIFDDAVLNGAVDTKVMARKVAARKKLTAWLHGKKISKDFKRRYGITESNKEEQAHDA